MELGLGQFEQGAQFMHNSNLEGLEGLLSDMCTDLGPRNDPVRVPLGPVTHAQTKQFKESLQALVQNVQNQQGDYRDIEGLEGDNLVVDTMMQAREESP